jgi:hypothetical protein
MEDVGPVPPASDDDEWATAVLELPAGTRVRATVLSHRPFGFFVVLDSHPRVAGLVEIISYAERGPPFPAIGSTIDAEVLGHRADHRLALKFVQPT